jgi:hypothetical protein
VRGLMRDRVVCLHSPAVLPVSLWHDNCRE